MQESQDLQPPNSHRAGFINSPTPYNGLSYSIITHPKGRFNSLGPANYTGANRFLNIQTTVSSRYFAEHYCGNRCPSYSRVHSGPPDPKYYIKRRMHQQNSNIPPKKEIINADH